MTDATVTDAAQQQGPGRLRGSVALVTGAPRSIGRAIVESLPDDGASVVHYRSRRDEADATGAALRERGAEAIALGGDLGGVLDERLAPAPPGDASRLDAPRSARPCPPRIVRRVRPSV